MGIVATKAIVLSALKYSDSSLIVKCFTKEAGLKSYMLRGVLKAKKGKLKAAYFQPLTQLQLIANHSNRTTLNSIKEVQRFYPYETIHTSIIKQSIVLFLSEVLSGIIKEEETNVQLYDFLETAFIWLDTHDSISNFHLLFLLELSKFLGFYPGGIYDEAKAFNLVEGRFTVMSHETLTVSGENFRSFKKLLGMNFDRIHDVAFSKSERQTILKIIIRYFELHLDGFKEPNSLRVLETVFT